MAVFIGVRCSTDLRIIANLAREPWPAAMPRRAPSPVRPPGVQLGAPVANIDRLAQIHHDAISGRDRRIQIASVFGVGIMASKARLQRPRLRPLFRSSV